MDPVEAELVAERPELDVRGAFVPMAGWLTPRYHRTATTVEVLDDVLAPTRTLSPRPPDGTSLLAVADDGTAVLGVAGDRLVLVRGDGGGAGEGWELPLRAPDDAAFLPGGRLLVTAPNFVEIAHGGRHREAKADHRVLLLDAATGRLLDEATLTEVADAGAEVVPHPTDGSVVLDLGEGQDGSNVYVVRVVEDRLEVRFVLRDVVVAGFSPDGTRLLVLPHPSYPAVPRLLGWPSLEVVTSADLDGAGIDPDGIDLYGCFLSDDRILLTTYEEGLWLADGLLADLRPLVLPDGVVGPDPEYGAVMPLSADTFSLKLYRPDDDVEVTTVWRIRPPAAAAPAPVTGA